MPEAREEPRDTAFFGDLEIPASEKGKRVRGVFASVARRYDLMNDLMSGGVHRLWKRVLVDRLAPRPGLKLLDVAGGTGDIALAILARLGPSVPVSITVCDLTPEMLAVGRRRAIDRGELPLRGRLDWLCGNAESLPLADRSVEAYSIAFGLRNVTHVQRALAEAHRVLKPGGHFLCLEFSQVMLPLLRELYDLYSFSVLPTLGALVAGDREAYSYLVESIRRFPPQQELAGLLQSAGFERVGYHNLSGGIAAIHSGWRL